MDFERDRESAVETHASPGWRFESAKADDAFSAREDFVAFLRRRASHTSDIGAAEIIYGELTGNVVRHAPGSISVEVEWTAERKARLRVQDTGPAFTYTPQLPEDILSESGRGLYVVALLAEDLCISQGSNGAAVTAILPVTAA